MPVSDSQQILDSLRRLVRLLRLTERAAQGPVGLSGAQLFVLYEISRTPSISLSDLAARTRTDQSSVSAVVTRLVNAGLVRRTRASDDARRLALTLTRSGVAVIRKAPPVAQETLIEILEQLPPNERKRFSATLTRVVEDLGAGGSAAPMFFEGEKG